jgi:hypothetical protein
VGVANRTGTPAARPAGGRPKTDPALLARAIELVRKEGLTPTEAAEQLGGISKTTIYDELRRLAATAVAEAAGEPPPAVAPAPSPHAPTPATSSSSSSTSSSSSAPSSPASAGEEQDDLAVYDDLIAQTKRRIRTAEPQRYAALVNVCRQLVEARQKLRPPKVQTDEEREAEERALADDVIRKLLQSVTDAEAQARADGRCAHCGGPLEREEPELGEAEPA